jgi:AcrR family transcriptional regulator
MTGSAAARGVAPVDAGAGAGAGGGAGADTADRILDAAGRCFATRGVPATTIADVARAAGVSRPTVYRWFADRDALLAAFVQRAARRLGARIAATAGRDDPGRGLVDAVLAAVDGVRADPTLAAWFAAESAGAALGAAAASPVIEALAAGFLGDSDDEDVRTRARWVVRVTVSLLAMPGRDRADERDLLDRFLVPVVVGGVPAGQGSGATSR